MIELLLVCAIIIVITSVVLVDNNRFGGEVILQNLAYDVALSVRQAQVYGIAVERYGTDCSTPGADCFSSGYGMHFQMDQDGGPATSYQMFADTEGTGVCDTSCLQNSIVQTTDLQQGYYISDLCAQAANSQQETCGLASLDVLFQRPEPDAYISINGISGIANPAAIQQEAEVVLESPKGSTSTVVIYAAGQISVQ